MMSQPQHATVGTYLKVAAILTIVTALEVGVIYIRRLAPSSCRPAGHGHRQVRARRPLLHAPALRPPRAGAVFVGPILIAVLVAVALMTLPGDFLVFD